MVKRIASLLALSFVIVIFSIQVQAKEKVDTVTIVGTFEQFMIVQKVSDPYEYGYAQVVLKEHHDKFILMKYDMCDKLSNKAKSGGGSLVGRRIMMECSKDKVVKDWDKKMKTKYYAVNVSLIK
jgi:hypothetical protein